MSLADKKARNKKGMNLLDMGTQSARIDSGLLETNLPHWIQPGEIMLPPRPLLFVALIAIPLRIDLLRGGHR
jgi:hypothetical protein